MEIKNIAKATVLSLSLTLPLTSCNDWLDLLPNNEQVTDDYWKSKEDVEQVVASGYYYMRSTVPTLINWGELRGGDFYNMGSGTKANKMQDFDMLPTNDLCAYGALYQVISMANSVLDYAPGVEDNTYYAAMRNSHLCEAYFQRAWAYSILVKNFKEVPLVTRAYVNDDMPLTLPKASESQIIAQIKSDVKAALVTGAAKGYYEVEWQTKGRATKWALYALMADICLWNHDYDECIEYANYILQTSDALRPAFMTETSKWFEMFYPGLSNESIFELYWDYNTENVNNNFTTKFPQLGIIASASEDGMCNVTEYALLKMCKELLEVLKNQGRLSADDRVGRILNASVVTNSLIASGSELSMSQPVLWKYRGTDIVDKTTVRVHNDANFILYRVADVMLMKAEALIMKGKPSWRAAIELINTIRTRAALPVYVDLDANDADNTIDNLDELTLLLEVLDQREMEFLGEAHRWYDILRLARYDKNFAPSGTVEDNEHIAYENYKTKGFGADEFKYKEQALLLITESNKTTSDAQLESILQNSWAWYLPLQQSEIENNNLLKQNPYYE